MNIAWYQGFSCSDLRIVVPPHGHQVKPFFKGFASLNLPPCYTRLNRGPTDVSQLLG